MDVIKEDMQRSGVTEDARDGWDGGRCSAVANPKESSEEKEAEEEEKMMKTITKMKEMMMLMMIMTGPILTKKAGSNIGDNKLIHKLTSERQQFGLLHAATPAASICMFIYF